MIELLLAGTLAAACVTAGLVAMLVLRERTATREAREELGSLRQAVGADRSSAASRMSKLHPC